jgi:hypothetical protein
MPAADLDECRRHACRYSGCARLSERGRSMRAHASDQFNERRRAGRSGVERRRQERNSWRRKNCKPVKRKIDMNETDNCWRKNFCRCCRDGAKNFTTLGPGRLRLRFCRLGMKWTTTLGRIRFCCDRAERAMIGNRDPRANRNRDDQATRNRSHTAFNRRHGANAQMFSFWSMMGAIGPEGMLSGGTTSGGGEVDVDPGAAGASCLIRVDINMAAKSNAAAR